MISQPRSVSSSSPLSEYISYIRTILNQLMRITIAIKKSGNRNRFEDIDNKCNENDYGAFRQFLTAKILYSFDQPMAQESDQNLPANELLRVTFNADRLGLVQQRLVRANVLRRNRIVSFRTKRPHQQEGGPYGELSSLDNKQEPIYNAQENDEQTKHTAVPSRSTAFQTQKKTGQSENSVVTRTATEPGSQLNIEHILHKGTKSAATKMTTIGASQDYPPRPKYLPNEPNLCPYCQEQLPPDMFNAQDESSWK
jgi:hypothetical protein